MMDGIHTFYSMYVPITVSILILHIDIKSFMIWFPKNIANSYVIYISE